MSTIEPPLLPGEFEPLEMDADFPTEVAWKAFTSWEDFQQLMLFTQVYEAFPRTSAGKTGKGRRAGIDTFALTRDLDEKGRKSLLKFMGGWDSLEPRRRLLALCAANADVWREVCELLRGAGTRAEKEKKLTIVAKKHGIGDFGDPAAEWFLRGIQPDNLVHVMVT